MMTDRLMHLRKRIDEYEQEFEASLAERRKALRYRLEGTRAVFEEDALKAHKALKKSIAKTLADARLRNLIAAPFIYAVIIPIALLDFLASSYQHVCFRLWNIPRVKRREFVIIDRHRLGYLNWIQKFNCLYCEYSNGVLPYVVEIASRTEQYWCPIKHAVRPNNPHKRYYEFIDYGDGEELDEKWERRRMHLHDENNRMANVAAEQSGGSESA